MLGNLLSRYPEFQNTDISDFLKIDKGTHKIYIECYERAYAMFVKLTSQGKICHVTAKSILICLPSLLKS